ncbi:hypothetical protein D9M68_977560 [compost metagenome]
MGRSINFTIGRAERDVDNRLIDPQAGETHAGGMCARIDCKVKLDIVHRSEGRRSREGMVLVTLMGNRVDPRPPEAANVTHAANFLLQDAAASRIEHARQFEI